MEVGDSRLSFSKFSMRLVATATYEYLSAFVREV